MFENSCTELYMNFNEEMWRIRTKFRSRCAVNDALHYIDVHETHTCSKAIL